MEFYDTDAQRDEAHKEAISEYRKDAIGDNEWSLDVENIVSGIVTHSTEAINDNGESCDYAPAPLYAAPTAPSLATDAGAVTDEQIIALALENGFYKSREHWGDRYVTQLGSDLVRFARALLATAPIE